MNPILSFMLKRRRSMSVELVGALIVVGLVGTFFYLRSRNK